MIDALDIQVKGIVQGVGFRPFVYRIAKKYLINGWVLNATDGVFIHAGGIESKLVDEFVLELSDNPPAASKVEEISLKEVPLEGFDTFEIRFSDAGVVEKTTLVSPDLATCDDCAQELLNPNDRRYRYPFINCTNCGPRFTIIEKLPYDRKSTSMKDFPMCERCAAEYGDPLDRRFHAQPDACFECGPQVSWREHEAGNIEAALGDTAWGGTRETSDAILARAVELLMAGKILAVKGLGGFHLACDASNAEAVALLRARKRREGKAFAVMMSDIESVRQVCMVSDAEEKTLSSTQKPIVLLRKRADAAFAPGLADVLPELGVMLPYTPLQYLLLHDFIQAGGAGMLVMTSGNIHDEPIVTDDKDAYQKLFAIADGFLGHNRAICARYDDSVVRIISAGSAGDALQFLRRARGYAPLPVPLAYQLQVPTAYQPPEPLDAAAQVPTAYQPPEPLDAAASCGTQSCHADDGLRTVVRGASASLPILGTTEGLADFGGPVGKEEQTGGPASEGQQTAEPASIAGRVGEPEHHNDQLNGPACGEGAPGKPVSFSVFAAGAEQKNTFALSRDSEVFVSQHIGDMENAETYDSWLAAKAHYETLFEITPTHVACDMHPEYLASKWAHGQELPVTEVQHHHAHVVATMAEHGLEGPVCGIAFDGTGYGADGNIWGGEVLLSNLTDFERFANFAYVPMPGGAAAVKHPLRMAYGVLWAFDLLDHPGAARSLEALGAQAALCDQMIERGINTPMTSSVGRLFDAASALLGICTEPLYEGEPAILLEAAMGTKEKAAAESQAAADGNDVSAKDCDSSHIANAADARAREALPATNTATAQANEAADSERYAITVVKNTATETSTAQDTSVVLFDAAPTFLALLDDLADGVPVSCIAQRFHQAFVQAIVQAAELVRHVYGIEVVVLSGGVFMNRFLIEHVLVALAQAGFTAAIKRDLPPNDGCISFGQAVVAWAANQKTNAITNAERPHPGT